MPSVALIGPDGAGKTTLARMLVGTPRLRLKYLYMGISTQSSNITLPTSRWAERFKSWIQKRSPQDKQPSPANGSRPRSEKGVFGRLWAAARLLNHLAEEWYRQLVSWSYQMRGYNVLYDRHYVLDFVNNAVIAPHEPFSRRLHRWMLTHLYPMPDLVIYLDAPAAVLYARKGELSIPELERRRMGFILLAKHIPNFVRVDATKPLNSVYAQVLKHLVPSCTRHSNLADNPEAELVGPISKEPSSHV